MPDGTSIPLRLTDDYGLPCDPMLYAKSSCNRCYGRGTRTITDMTEIKGKTRYTHKGPNLVNCTCVNNEYQKVIATLPAPEKAKPPAVEVK